MKVVISVSSSSGQSHPFPIENCLVQHSTGSDKTKSIGWLTYRFVSLALRYYRIEKAADESIRLGDPDGEVPVPTETGTRSRTEDEIELSKLVERINERLGTDFTAADELFLQQVKEDALDDESLRRSARANTRSNFAHIFDAELTDMFIDRMDQNEDLFAEYIDDQEVRDSITDLLRKEVYEASREPAES